MPDKDGLWRSPRGLELLRSRDVGGAIRFARQARGWQQADLARAAGYSVSTISRLETGRRAAVDLDLLRRVAYAAGISPVVLGVLTGLAVPYPATVKNTADASAEEAAMRRREMLAAAGLVVPAQMLAGVHEALAVLPAAAGPVTVSGLSRQLAAARELYDAGRTMRLISGMPALLSSAQSLAQAGRHPGAYAAAAAAYDLATDAMIKTGQVGAARITADRAVNYAGLSGSAVAQAYAARAMSIVLRHQEQHVLAAKVTHSALTGLEQTGLHDLPDLAAYARILCTTAYSAARAGHKHQALDMIREAAAAARRTRGRPAPDHRTVIDTAQVGLYAVSVHWALGDPAAALQSASRLHPGQFPTPERRARLHTDIARVWWQQGNPERAAAALLAAHGESPADVCGRPAIRGIAEDIIRLRPRAPVSRELRAATGIGHQHGP